MKQLLKVLVSLLVIVLVLGGLAYLYLYYAPTKSVNNVSADYVTNVETLYDTYQRDENAGNIKYIDKTIQVTGILSKKTMDQEGSPVVMLKSENGRGGVMCTLEANQLEALEDKMLGEEITVKGFCTGILMEVILNRGVVIE